MAERKTRIYRSTNQTNYSVINNEVLRRDDLSWKAKGIMCYILSLPNDWEIYLEELQRHATDGKSSFRSGWNELKEKGYVKRHPIKEGGKFVEWRTEIVESLDLTTFPPYTDFPQVEKPQMEKPQVENRKLLSTYNTNYLNKLSTDNNYGKSGLEEIRNFFQGNGFGSYTQYISETINFWIDDFIKIGSTQEEAESLILESLKIGVVNNARKWKYSEAILKDWESHAVTNLELVNESKNKKGAERRDAGEYDNLF